MKLYVNFLEISKFAVDCSAFFKKVQKTRVAKSIEESVSKEKNKRWRARNCLTIY